MPLAYPKFKIPPCKLCLRRISKLWDTGIINKKVCKKLHLLGNNEVSMRKTRRKLNFAEVICNASIKLFHGYDLCLQPERALFQSRDIRGGGSGSKSSMENVLRELKEERGGGHRCPTPPAGCTKIGVDCKGRTVPLTTTVNAKPEISISPETAQCSCQETEFTFRCGCGK